MPVKPTLLLTLLLCACATTAPLPTVERPELARLAEPYVAQLRAVGITRMVVAGTRESVRLDTGYGAVYLPYPTGLASTAFVLEIGADYVRASALTFDPAHDAQLLAALVPEAVQVTAANNTFGWWRANPVR